MKIIGVGRNYSAHAKELGNEVPDEPVIFLKPDTALLRKNADFYLPEFSKNIHFECEIVFRISREGKYISRRFAQSYIDGVGLGIDFTARDIQQKCKEKGLPWTLAKGFNHSAPVSEFLSPEGFGNFDNIDFRCSIDGELRQKGNTREMLFDIHVLIEFISQYITLKKGDMIFTGTPKGVGQVFEHNHIEGWLGDKKLLDFTVK